MEYIFNGLLVSLMLAVGNILSSKFSLQTAVLFLLYMYTRLKIGVIITSLKTKILYIISQLISYVTAASTRRSWRGHLLHWSTLLRFGWHCNLCCICYENKFCSSKFIYRSCICSLRLIKVYYYMTRLINLKVSENEYCN